MIVNRLPFILAEKQVSIRQLARLTGYTYTTIRAVYHGERRSVQLEVLDAICRVLAVQPGDIYQVRHEGDTNRQDLEPEAGTAELIEQPAPETQVKSRRGGWQNW